MNELYSDYVTERLEYCNNWMEMEMKLDDLNELNKIEFTEWIWMNLRELNKLHELIEVAHIQVECE